MPLTTMEELHVPDKGGGPSGPDKREGSVSRVLGKGVFPLVLSDQGGLRVFPFNPGGKREGINIPYIGHLTCAAVMVMQIFVTLLLDIGQKTSYFANSRKYLNIM